ncbi:MAG: N-6 DNA methylase, partial [Phycisphaerales bacterium]|nr:N-6 DNA methylase [Phycisphaerales bacterium]
STGAPIGVWSNGNQQEFYHRTDPNHLNSLSYLPDATLTFEEFLDQLDKITILDVLYGNKLNTKTLKDIIEQLEDEVLANSGVDVFEESFKLIFAKLYDEWQSEEDIRRIEDFLSDNDLRNVEDLKEFDKKKVNKLKERLRVVEFRGTHKEKAEEREYLKMVKKRVEDLFQRAKKHWGGVFEPSSKLELTDSHLNMCVSYLQTMKLFNSNLEIIDEAFEHLINQSAKGEKGQYFTPRYVIDMCVKMLNPTPTESIIDPAAGSCGFPVHGMFHVWKKLEPNKKHLFSTEKKSKKQIEYVKEKVFAIDFDPRAVRVGRTLNLIAGDGETNVIKLNSLDYGRWQENENSEDWQDVYRDGFKRLKSYCADKNHYSKFQFDIVMANPPFAGDIKERGIIGLYEIARKDNDKMEDKIGRDILFIERCLNFLKPGGRMAIVLPQGRFNNSSDKRIREFIAERCRILAVVGLHQNTFKPHTGTKTSVLFVQKWNDDVRVGQVCKKVADYNIFFATQTKPGKDNSGDKIYAKDALGSRKKDKHGHFIVEHDLFNHNLFTSDTGKVLDEGETQDGIAEAFIEFAKKEKLSFF